MNLVNEELGRRANSGGILVERVLTSDGFIPRQIYAFLNSKINNDYIKKIKLMLEDKWRKNQCSKDMSLMKMHVRHHLFNMVMSNNGFKIRNQKLDLCVVGSSLSGLDTKESDLDLCLMIADNYPPPEKGDTRNDAINILNHIKLILEEKNIDSQVIPAKTPILKFKMPDVGVEVNININMENSILNSHLLRCYKSIDVRVQQLIVIVKTWAKLNEINDPRNNTLSSYSWTLMIIHFLQTGCQPPVLPILQLDYLGIEDAIFDRTNPSKYKCLDQIASKFKSINSDCLGTLFAGFLRYYYSTFNLRNSVVSIRRRKITKRNSIKEELFNDWPNQTSKPIIYVEEPFTSKNTAYSICKEESYSKIIKVFKKTLLNFKRGRFILKTESE